jgi:hypothetical protein
MKVKVSFLCLISMFLSLTPTAFADFKLRQQTTMEAGGGESFTMERAIWVKGMRERTENKFADERMSQMIPQIAEVRQCDLRQTLRINDRSKKYLIEPFYDSSDKPLPPVQASTKTDTFKSGTVTFTTTLTDTGERRQMFGLTARHLIIKRLAESTKDSCDGESRMSTEEDGWFVYLVPENANCQVDLPRGERRETSTCRNKVIMKGPLGYPGMMLEGTTKMIDLLKKSEMKTSIKTLDLSKATLEMSLFEIPAGYSEANSEQSLMSMGNLMGNMTGMMNGSTTGKTPSSRKSVAVDFFSGSVSKINQPNLRQFVASQVSGSGANAVLIASQNDITSGAYQNVIGVEIKSVKESGASKIGGLFGKVTGTDDAAKLGKSEVEVIVTLYAGDGKTVIATGTAKEKVDGKADDAAKAAIEKALGQVLGKLK